MPSLVQTGAVSTALLAIAGISGFWFKLVSEQVPDPYLDEVFHVPQAQRYCQRDYAWDPKITTPPGLYLMSLSLKPFFGDCDVSSLRLLNIGAICMLCVLAHEILRTLHTSNRSQPRKGNARESQSEVNVVDRTSILDAHSALNISLFPPLFFFSALYYTDVMSTLLVLISYGIYLKTERAEPNVGHDVFIVATGIFALSLRQTNIFWVAIFPAGLSIVKGLKKNGVLSSNVKGNNIVDILNKSWSKGQIYDVLVDEASPQDYVLVLVSIPLAAISRPKTVFRIALPYLVLLGSFGSFVLWNGGVVLGDKSNHVATIHLPQMLYIWPYIAFFSTPLVVAPILRPLIQLIPHDQFKAFCEDNIVGSSNFTAPNLTFSFTFLTLGLAAAHFNTIVHPFTLADNRHYVFYVFRVLRRHPSIKYIAVPVYALSAWICAVALRSGASSNDNSTKHRKVLPFADNEAKSYSTNASFILIWLAATTLSVISAPLVEPRYFIIPWTIWRLNIPYVTAAAAPRRSSRKAAYDMRLVFETVWHLAINAAIGYNFLYRGFTWSSEPGKVQRFLW